MSETAAAIGLKVFDAMGTMSESERRAFAHGVAMAYHSAFDAIREECEDKPAPTVASALGRINAQWQDAHATLVVAGVL